jgi:hypothetical protein
MEARAAVGLCFGWLVCRSSVIVDTSPTTTHYHIARSLARSLARFFVVFGLFELFGLLGFGR